MVSVLRHIPLLTIQINSCIPTVSPEIPVAGSSGLAIVAEDVVIQTPVPTNGETAARLVVVVVSHKY